MSTSTYEAFRDALVGSPEYLEIPHRERRACKKFLGLVSNLGSEQPPEATELESGYAAAVAEARGLVERGLLTGVALPDDGDHLEAEAVAPDETATEEGTKHADPPFHPLADMFPMMSEEELQELAEDIKEHGLRTAIVLFQCMVIDGRNRLRACRIAGVEPRFEEWNGSGSLVAWVLGANLHRRHLTDQQRAMVAARAKAAFEAEAQARRLENLQETSTTLDARDPGRRENTAKTEEPSETPQILESPSPGSRVKGRSAAKAGVQLGVSTDAVERASRVLKKGDPSLVDAVTAGTVSLDAAATVALLPKDEQRDAVQAGRVKEVAKGIRAKKKGKTVAKKPKGDTTGPREATTSKPRAAWVNGLEAGVERLPKAQRKLAVELLDEVRHLVAESPTASEENVEVAFTGLVALVSTTRKFLAGKAKASFLKQAIELHGKAKNGRAQTAPLGT